MKKYILLKSIILLIGFLFFMNSVKAAEIKLGTYKIVNADNANIIIVEKNGNIELGNDSSTGEKSWDVYSADGAFYIKSHNNNNYSFDVAGAEKKNKTNIRLFNVNNTNAQKWIINYAGNYSYYLTSLLGNYNLDVSNNKLEINANVELYQKNDKPSQKWKFIKIDEYEQTIQNGTYIIKPGTNNNNAFELAGAGIKNCTNIRTWSFNNTWAQLWKINYNNGYYTITSMLDESKAVDISGAVFKRTTNIQLFQSNNTNAQKFLITKNQDNSYSIRSFDGLWIIDIANGSTNYGANIQLFQPNDTKAQKFYFEKVNFSDIESGYYNIETINNHDIVIGVNNKALANFKNVELQEKTVHNYTKWYIKKLTRDIYSIANADNTKMVLDVSGNATVNGTNIQLYKSNGTTAQQWIIRKNEDNTYKIIGVSSNKMMDIQGGNYNVGSNIQIYQQNNSDAQKYNIIPTEVSDYSKEYDNGQYIIKGLNNLVFDIAGGAKSNGTNVRLFSQNNTPAQIWKVVYNGDGEYIICSMINPRIVLTASSNNVVSSKNTNSDYQKWFFDKDGDTTFILNKATGKYLSLDGTNVVLTTNSTDKFSLSVYNKKIPYRGMDVSNHQGDINWSKVATSNIDFVVIRAGYAEEKIVDGVDQYEDRRFVKNVQECEKYNIPYSLYLYSYANYVTGNYDSATLEANHMLNLFKKIKNKGYYPPMSTAVYFDQEDESIKNLSKATLTAMINEFCGKMNNNGHKCGVYANMNWLNNKINVSQVVNKHTIWVAQWPGYNTFDRALASQSSYTTTPHELWQFTSDGSISGISGRVDLDIGYDIFK